MKFIRIFPEAWASTSWPVGNSTRNVTLGSASVTVPSSSIASFFGKPFIPYGRASDPFDRTLAGQFRENLRSRLRDFDGVLKVS